MNGTPPDIPNSLAPPSPGLLGRIFEQRGILANLPLLYALFSTRGATNDPLWTWSLGFALLLLGIAVRIWAQAHIQHRLLPETSLTATGPYQYMRNPLYVGNTLLILGGTAFSKLLWLLPISLVWCALIYSLVVRHEESTLVGRYGDSYLRYLSQVPRWLPRPGGNRRLEFVNQNTSRAVIAELHCFLIPVAFLIKDMVVNPAWHSLWGG